MINKKEIELTMKIVNRAWVKMEMNYKDKLSMVMDIEAANKDCPMDLQRLLEADDCNFYHDIIGIGNYLNRQTKKLENCFCPRFAKKILEG